MDDLDFYNKISDPASGLSQETIGALMYLFHKIEKIEEDRNNKRFYVNIASDEV